VAESEVQGAKAQSVLEAQREETPSVRAQSGNIVGTQANENYEELGCYNGYYSSELSDLDSSEFEGMELDNK
jgi:hypothetical protein